MIKPQKNLHTYPGLPLQDCASGTDKDITGHGYFRHYQLYFQHLRNKPIRLLEFGVGQAAGSLKTWAKFFPKATIIGVDIDPLCERQAGGRVSIHTGDLNDPEFIAKLKGLVGGPVDIIIDDALHTPSQQIQLFKEFFPTVLKDQGIYVVEDMGFSYIPNVGGGFRKSGTSMEFFKDLADQPNYDLYRQTSHNNFPEVYKTDLQTSEIADYERMVYSIHFYRECCFIFKGSYH